MPAEIEIIPRLARSLAIQLLRSDVYNAGDPFLVFTDSTHRVILSRVGVFDFPNNLVQWEVSTHLVSPFVYEAVASTDDRRSTKLAVLPTLLVSLVCVEPGQDLGQARLLGKCTLDIELPSLARLSDGQLFPVEAPLGLLGSNGVWQDVGTVHLLLRRAVPIRPDPPAQLIPLDFQLTHQERDAFLPLPIHHPVTSIAPIDPPTAHSMVLSPAAAADLGTRVRTSAATLNEPNSQGYAPCLSATNVYLTSSELLSAAVSSNAASLAAVTNVGGDAYPAGYGGARVDLGRNTRLASVKVGLPSKQSSTLVAGGVSLPPISPILGSELFDSSAIPPGDRRRTRLARRSTNTIAAAMPPQGICHTSLDSSSVQPFQFAQRKLSGYGLGSRSVIPRYGDTALLLHRATAEEVIGAVDKLLEPSSA